MPKLDFQNGNPLSALRELPSSITSLPDLELLNLNGTRISNIEAVASCPALKSLYLIDTLIEDVSALSSLPKLDVVNLSGTRVADLEPLKSSENLQLLFFERSRVTDLTALQFLTDLRKLGFSGTPVSDLAPISNLIELTELKLSGTNVRDLGPAARLIKLIEGAKRKPIETEFITFGGGGLEFHNTPATRNDPNLQEIAKLEQPERTIQTLQYLNGEHPVYGGPPGAGGGWNNETPTKSSSLKELAQRPTAKVVIRLGKIDLDPVESDDEPENPEDRDLATLPERQKLAAERLISALGHNQPATRTALQQYAKHIAANGAILEILREAMETAEAGMAQAAREQTIDDDVARAWNRFCLNDTTYFANYPLDAERDALYRKASVDWERALAENFANAFAEFRDAIKNEDYLETIGDNLLNWAEVSTSYSEILATEHFNRGSALKPLTDETDAPTEQISGPDTPLDERIKRQVGQGAVVAKEMIDSLDSDAGKRVKNSAWLLGHAQKLWDILSGLF